MSLRADVVDVSDYIRNNNFEGDATAWTVAFGGYGAVPQSDGVREAWASDNGNKWFYCYRDTLVPAGVYRLTAGAYHRGYLADKTNIILYATTRDKEFSVGVKSLQSETAAYGSTPNSRVTAKTAFNAGFWTNTVDEIVVPDEGGGLGTLRVGIRNIAQAIRATTATSGDVWTAWSNFKLYQLTGADLDAMRDKAVADANALLAEPTDYSDGGTFAGQIATLSGMADADLTVAAIQTLQANMTTYRNNRMASASSVKPANVTHLINNASFEAGQKALVGTANGHYNEPIGWKLTYMTPVDVNNMITIVNNKVVPAGVAAGVSVQPTDGERALVSRFRWTSSHSMSISQTVKNLAGGKYKVSADLGKLSANGNTGLQVMVQGASVLNQAATFVAGPAFTNVNATFDALQGDSLVITATMSQPGQVEATIILDNIKLEYLGVEPFVSTSQAALSFSPSVTQKTLNIRAGNISDDITLTVPAGFSASQSTIPAASAMTSSGVDIQITSTATADVATADLIFASGSVKDTVTLSVAETAITVSHLGLFFDQSYNPGATITVSGDLFNDIALTAPAGVTLSQNSISKAEALAGKTIDVSWDAATRVNDADITLSAGAKTAAVKVFAVADNMISNWDGDNAEGEGSKLTDFGWSLNNAAGDPATVSFNNYNATSGVRYVTFTSSLVYTYQGKAWLGHRIAYLRSWAADFSNTYNLAVTLEAGKEYIFRGVGAWHNNETNPSFTYSVRTAKDAAATVLGTQTNAFTVRQAGADYKFEFTPTADGVHYVSVSSSAPNDAMAAPMYLSIVPKSQSPGTSVDKTGAAAIQVYPTVTNGAVNVRMSESGSIRVFDISGRVVLNKQANAEIETVELPSAGVFFMEVNSGNTSRTVKVIRVQ
jgi:hypothetical protein